MEAKKGCWCCWMMMVTKIQRESTHVMSKFDKSKYFHKLLTIQRLLRVCLKVSTDMLKILSHVNTYTYHSHSQYVLGINLKNSSIYHITFFLMKSFGIVEDYLVQDTIISPPIKMSKRERAAFSAFS